MSDRNKRGETICEWSDLPVNGCAHCHGKTDPAEIADTASYTNARTGSTRVALPSYRGLPYYRAAHNIPTPTGGRECGCSRPAGDAYICPTCADRVQVNLADIPALVEDLLLAQARMDNTHVNLHPRGVTETARILEVWPGFDEAATDPDTIVTSAKVVRDVIRRWTAILQRGRPSRKGPGEALEGICEAIGHATRTLGRMDGLDVPISTQAEWVSQYIDQLTRDPSAPQVAQLLQAAHDRALAQIDNAPELIVYGWCTGKTRTGQSGECGNLVAVPRGAVSWICPACRTSYNIDAMEQMRIDRARGENLTVVELAQITGKTPKAVRGVLARRNIESVGRTRDDVERWVKLYPAGAYLDTL